RTRTRTGPADGRPPDPLDTRSKAFRFRNTSVQQSSREIRPFRTRYLRHRGNTQAVQALVITPLAGPPQELLVVQDDDGSSSCSAGRRKMRKPRTSPSSSPPGPA